MTLHTLDDRTLTAHHEATRLRKQLRRLSMTQHEVMADIMTNQNKAYHSGTLKSLLARGLVEAWKERTITPIGVFTVTRYRALPAVVHAWEDLYEHCSCGRWNNKECVCQNPATTRCSMRVNYGVYNRKTKRWE